MACDYANSNLLLTPSARFSFFYGSNTLAPVVRRILERPKNSIYMRDAAE